HFFRVPAIVKTCERVLGRLRLQSLPQSNVRHREPDLRRERGFEVHVRLAEAGVSIGSLNVKDSQGLALREDGDANIGVCSTGGVSATSRGIPSGHERGLPVRRAQHDSASKAFTGTWQW